MNAALFEESCPLSPFQESLLKRAARGGRQKTLAPGGIQQLIMDLRETLDVPAFARAWSQVAERHADLRVCFRTDDRGETLQAVCRQIEITVEAQDWRDTPADEQETRWQSLLEDDRRRGFDLARAPLLRLTLVRRADNAYAGVLTCPHVLLDEPSFATVLNEVFTFYDAGFRGKEPPLSAPRTYHDHVHRPQEPDWSEAEAHWRQALKGFRGPAPLTLSPTAAPAGATHGERITRLSADLTASLREYAGRHGLTPGTLVLGAFAALLSRYSGEEDVALGVTRNCRPPSRTGEGPPVGLFTNTLPVRVQVSPEITALPFLQGLHAQAVALGQHAHTPLWKVQECSEVPWGTPLFECVVEGEDSDLDETLRAWGGGWANRDFRLLGETAYPLTLRTAGGERLQLQARYERSRFDDVAIERLLGHLRSLLEGLLAHPGRPVAALPMLDAAERRQVLQEWNATAADYPRDRCVYQFFEGQAAQTPERVAVVFEGQALTYRELNARANQLARHLRGLGVGPETLVGLCVERSAEMVVALLGILKAGGAYVPLDPEFPADRLAFYAQDSAMPVLLAQRRTQARLPACAARVVWLDDDRATVAGHGADNLGPTAGPDNLAYVIYTSGSTGKPKGVQVLHGALTNFLNSMRRAPGLSEDDALLALTTLSFDIHTLELWLPLIVGARVVVLGREAARDGLRLAEALRTCGATALQATPASWRMLLESGWEGDSRLKALCGGEPMTVELAERLLPRVGSLWNMYGPTETTVWSTLHLVRSARSPILIGRPIDNTQAYVVDPHGNSVPVGVVGELLLGGDGLARGYLNRPELTAEKFIFWDEGGVPSAGEPAQRRVYRTGDLARRLPDGSLECLGRVDHQVKVRGFRIELAEIETVLGQYPGVRANVVVARADESGVAALAAYLVPQAGQACPPEDLRRFLRERLPDYMVPSHFVALEAFPLTPNGKIDRKALPAPRPAAGAQGRAVAPPTHDAERDLLPLWEEVLKVKPIGVTDNFFDLGGNSLVAAVLVAKIRQRLGHSLPLGALAEAPTVGKLAAVLERQLESGAGSSLVPLHEGGSNPALFMVAGVGGHVFTFHKFARLVGPEQPVYGVKAIGVDGAIRPPETVEEMAAHYAREITTLRPRGPYLLSGYSIGAVVAFELARQLRALGHRVDALFVFDMLAPGYPRKLPLPRRLWMHLRTFLGLPRREKKAYLAERLDKVRVRVRHWLGQSIRNAPDVGVEGLPQEALKRVWLALVTAAGRYSPPGPFDGKVVLFKAEEEFRWPATVLDDPLYGWGRWALGGVEAHTVPGNHMEIFHDGNIGLVARLVTESVARLAR